MTSNLKHRKKKKSHGQRKEFQTLPHALIADIKNDDDDGMGTFF